MFIFYIGIEYHCNQYCIIWHPKLFMLPKTYHSSAGVNQDIHRQVLRIDELGLSPLISSKLEESIHANFQPILQNIVLSNREFSDDNDKLLTYLCALANEQAGGFIYFCHAYRGSMIKQGFRNVQNSHVQYVREIVEKNLNRIQNARKNIQFYVDCLCLKNSINMVREQYNPQIVIRIQIKVDSSVKRFFYLAQNQTSKAISSYWVGKVQNQSVVCMAEGENLYDLMVKVAKLRRGPRPPISHRRFRYEISLTEAKQWAE